MTQINNVIGIEVRRRLMDIEDLKHLSAEAQQRSLSAEEMARLAELLSKSTKAELDQIVIEGDSSVEAAQARVDAKGEPHNTLKARLDWEQNEVSGKLMDNENNLKDRGVNVRDFADLEIDGDFTPVIQAAMDSGYPIIEFPSWTKTLKTPVLVPPTVKEIRFNNMFLKYDKEQKSLSPSYRESMFIVDGVDNLKVIGGKVEYLGVFNLGPSYEGKISSFYVINSDDFYIKDFEAKNFNSCGINIAPSKTDVYCENPTIENCYLHHNRISGLAFGNTNGILVVGNKLMFNGHYNDIETGYGLAGWKQAYPKNSIIKNNHVNYNYRKGIDFHSGFNGIIDGNYCIGNWIYGIYIMTENISIDGLVKPIGDWKVTNNIINNMYQQGNKYTAMYGIVVGTFEQQQEKSSFLIEGNSINGLDKGNISSYPIYIISGGLVDSMININNNVIDVDNITSFIRFQEFNTLDGNVSVKINSNKMSCNNVTVYFIYLRKDSGIRNMSVLDNEVEVGDETDYTLTNWGDYKSTDKFNDTTSFFNNNRISALINMVKNSNVLTGYVRDNTIHTNNFYNGDKLRDWDGRVYAYTSNTYSPHEGLYWTRGSYIINRIPNVFGVEGERYVVAGWLRITTGTENVIGVDWLENKIFTGD